jgi:hypothetical protein
MNDERQSATAQYSYLKRQLYELGQYCQALVNQIHEETETFLSDKDFSAMDFKKIETLAKELQQKQTEYKYKVDKFNKLKETYSFGE